MTNKRNLVMGIFLSLLIITLMTFSLTYARYTDELQSDGEISGDIEYIVSNQIEVDSVNSFISAIENGYTNIKISDDVDNPLIITGGVSDVNSDLTIDLNGHELQRNNRDPVLNVTDGVRLTIKDSKGGGCFYNPVGSALRVSGGTLTVTSGIFESGPRTGHGYPEDGDGFIDANYRYAGEYVTGNTSAAGATIGSAEDVTYYKPEKPEGGAYVIDTGITSMPIITPNVQEVTENNEKRFRINGNMYFENGYPSGASEPTIPADTYLYYTISGANVENTNMAATDKSADFYYTYYVTQNVAGEVSYAGTTESADTLLVTVYGYTEVKGEADSSANFAAIQMEDGYLDVQGGRYTAYFGKGETNCVYASGGEMTVQNGAFEALRSGVCVRMASQSTSAAAGKLAVRSGSFYSEQGDTIFVTGGNMSVTGGTFTKNTVVYDASSQTAAGANNAAIHVSGGKLVMTGAGENNRITFSLTGSHLYGINVEHGDASTLAEGDMAEISYAAFTFEGVGNNNYAINSENAAVSVENTNFTFGGASTSNRCISVSGEDAKASVTTATFTYNGGSSNYAVYSAGGTVTGTDLSFAFNGDGSSNTGIYTTGGTVSLTHGEFNFNEGATEGTSDNRGIHSKGGKVEVKGEENTFIFNAAANKSSGNYGIYSEKVTSGTAAGTITCNNSTFTINGSYSAGILAFGGTVTLGGTFDCTVQDGRTESQSRLSSTAISVEGGTVNLKEGSTSTITTNGLGITSLPGDGSASSEININGNLTLAPDEGGDNGTAIYLNGGELNIAESATVKITCNLAKNGTTALRWAPAPTNSTTTGATIDPNNGIYVNGGSLISNGILKVTHTGVQNDQYQDLNGDPVQNADDESYYENNNYFDVYKNFKIKSYAVRVTDGNVTIKGGTITNSVGGGVYVSGNGKVILGSSSSSSADANSSSSSADANGIVISTTGNTVYQRSWQTGFWPFQTDHFSWIGGSGKTNWRYLTNLTGGHAVEVNGGNLLVYNGSYTATQGEGILVRNGNAYIVDGTFHGGDVYKDSGNSIEGEPVAGPAASYGFKMIGGNVSIFNGSFGGNGSGAFIMGTSTAQATANIYGGNFEVTGQAGVSVYEYATLTVTPNGTATLPATITEIGTEVSQTGTDVFMKGNAAGLVIEQTGDAAAPTLTIKGGSYQSIRDDGGDGVWNGNQYASLTINGGTFTGSSRSGLFIDKNVGRDTIQISGGTFTGSSGGISVNGFNLQWSAIIASGHNAYINDTNDTLSGDIRYNNSQTVTVLVTRKRGDSSIGFASFRNDEGVAMPPLCKGGTKGGL